MKPSPFGWSAPTSLDEALDLLARVGADGKVLAGGQSLLPILNMRLAAPAHLVDINRLDDLAYVRVEDEVCGWVRWRGMRRSSATGRHTPCNRCCVRRCGWWHTP